MAVLLLALCVLLVVHHRRLRQKNRELVVRIRSQEEVERRAEEAARQAEAEQPADELSREMQLFRRLQALLADEEVLRRPRLGRDELAEMLGTNRTYVADAVAACTEQLFPAPTVLSMALRPANTASLHPPSNRASFPLLFFSLFSYLCSERASARP